MLADGSPSTNPPPALTCTALSKSYAGTRVLDSFECSVAAGAVLALIGENGSGKSTLIKTLAGVVSPDPGSGPVCIGGEELSFGSPESSLALGCRFVHQDLGLINQLSVLDNMLLVSGFPTRIGSIRARASRAVVKADLARVGLEIDPSTLVGELSPAIKTGVAVARAMRPVADVPVRLLVLDEPTATLPDDEVGRLMSIVTRARQSGIGILYVTHRLEEVFELGGTVTVLRDGKQVVTRPLADLDKRQIVNLMTGAELASEMSEDADRRAAPGAPRLVVHGLRGGPVAEVSFTVCGGEIVGIAGITGSGREAVLPMLFGGQSREAGSVLVGEDKVPGGRPDLAVTLGVGYLPPDRKTTGGFLTLTVAENTTIANLRSFSSAAFINRKAERALAKEWTERMGVRPAHALDLPLANLSGGNQQKVLFGKWLRLGLRVFLLDEPTQGVDVNAKALLHRQLISAAEEGLAAVVASTDLEELVAICDRVLVMRNGRIVADLYNQELTESAISQACLESGAEELV
jgi:ribose transport system ATP-binding protein